MIEEPSYAKDAPKITDTLKIYKVVKKIHKDVDLLTFTVYQQILNDSIANTMGNRKIEFCWS